MIIAVEVECHWFVLFGFVGCPMSYQSVVYIVLGLSYVLCVAFVAFDEVDNVVRLAIDCVCDVIGDTRSASLECFRRSHVRTRYAFPRAFVGSMCFRVQWSWVVCKECSDEMIS